MRRRLETFIALCLYYSGLVKLFRWWTQSSGRKLVILCYHRASGGDLRQHLLYLRRHYRLLHLEAALEELYAPHKNGSPSRDRRTPLVLTFDDGYHDNYTHALTLARELQIPITIFLVPGYIESGRRFWWQEAQYLISHTQMSEATIEGSTYHMGNAIERKAVAQAIDARVRHSTSVIEREEFLTLVWEILAKPSANSAEEKTSLPLTWTEVQTMEESQWISYGAHAMHHPILAYLTNPTEVQYEVFQCRIVLEQHLGHPVRTFAYPVGQPEHIGEQALRAVQNAGYDWAVTTMNGHNTPQTDPHLLRRFIVDVDQPWQMVAAKASGAWSFFFYLFQMPLTLLR